MTGMNSLNKNIPTIIIVLGATGDLMKKKIVPALFNLYKDNKLPKLFHFIGFSRRPLSSADFREYVKSILDKESNTSSFLAMFSYQSGQLEKTEDYNNLSSVLGRIDGEWKACSNKLFYLAVPPVMYEPILKNLSSSGLTIPCSPEEGWTRILVEKPFGKNLKTSEDLDKLLSSLFKEEQIYRIDHYLGKDMLQNILQFRFSNNLFEDSWNNKCIEKVEIRLLEKIGVEQRGNFYDGLGALRDVGQNHLLQMLALITMERPESFTAKVIREKRANILELLNHYVQKEIKKYSFRGQYDRFRSIKGVSPNSTTETYFKICAYLKSQRWNGVPFILESGKRMGLSKKEIVVTFNHPTPCLCPPSRHYKNKIIFRLEPKEEIVMTLFAKKPGLENKIEERKIQFLYKGTNLSVQYVESYEKLLFDAILGDQTLFASTKEISAMWKFTDPIVEAWNKNVVPLIRYAPDKAEISEKAKYVEQDDNLSVNKNKNIGIIGLGKMGSGIVLQLVQKGWNVYGYNRTESVTKNLEQSGLKGRYTIESMIKSLPSPRIVWLMLPAGPLVDDMIRSLIPLLSKKDLIIDGGNSLYKDSIRRSVLLKSHHIRFMDIGVSGGPSGAKNGACLMVGGEKKDFLEMESLIKAIAAPSAYGYFGKVGAGHFAKMVHNGIEYGMMEAIAEGAAVLKKSRYDFDLQEVFRVYNNRSVIESRLVEWAQESFVDDQNLKNISSVIQSSGEGEWTVKIAKDEGVSVPVIEQSLLVRRQSKGIVEESPNGFRNKVVTALRGKFGQHKVGKK